MFVILLKILIFFLILQYFRISLIYKCLVSSFYFFFFFFFPPVHNQAIITDSWIQMKGNSSFNFLQCSCPMLKSSTIPSDEFLLWEHYQLRANLMEVSAKHCKNHSYCTLKFNILSLSAPLHLWSAFCRKLMRLSVCETRGEFTTVADRCTLRYKYQYIKRKHSHPAGWYSTKQGNSPVNMDKSK